MLGIIILNSSSPIANSIAYQKVGNLRYISGQTAQYNGALNFAGKVGNDFGTGEAYDAVKLYGLSLVGQVKVALSGNLDRVQFCVKHTIYIYYSTDCTTPAKVASSVSDIIITIIEVTHA